MCSTTKTIEILGGDSDLFWDNLRMLTEDNKSSKEKLLSYAPTPMWMHSLALLAGKSKICLDSKFLKESVASNIELYPNVENFLKDIKDLEKTPRFKKSNIKISHFVVSAGLQDLIKHCFNKDLITNTFGSIYKVVTDDSGDIVNVPIFCMDKTMKTRSIFEIAKGSFKNYKPLSKKVPEDELLHPFNNMIYIGDGPTDIPALSLVRERGGAGAVVYDPKIKKDKLKENLHEISLDHRADFITPADYSSGGKFFKFISIRCHQILQRYESGKIFT